MEFEWDKNKNKSNIEKHGIDFSYAKDVFFDRKRISSPDLRKDYGENRWVSIGKFADTIIVVIYTIRNNIYRIISARYAKKKERTFYENEKI